MTEKTEIFIGARELGNEIYKIMPTYSLLLNQLQEITERAQSFKDPVFYREKKNIERREYNNTIGIFGARGTGKSSALYTIQKELSNSDYNILLPIIEPDNFGDNTKIIGSIVGFLCREGKHLICELEKNGIGKNESLSEYYKNGILKPNNPLQRLIYETIEYHLYTENQYRELLGSNYEDLANHIKKSERLLIPDIEFKKKLNDLVQEIIIVKTALNTNCSENDHADFKVMLYIFIDDIDLKTNKTRELMHALLQYTNHPNIVTILSGDYDLLRESLTFSLLADEPLNLIGLSATDTLQEELQYIADNKDENITTKNKSSILQRKIELAHQYLKKIISPASRYQLVKWNISTIPNFAFGSKTLMDTLSELIGRDSFFSYIDDFEKISPIKLSYSIFEERPRGIINVYYHLNHMLNSSEKTKESEKFRMVKSLIDTIITSNNKFLEHQHIIFEEFLLWGSDSQSTVINYSKISRIPNLNIELLIIAEMLKYLLDISFDQEIFQFQKQKAARTLLTLIPNRDEAIKVSENIMIESNSDYYKFKRYNLLLGVCLIADLKEILFIHELLSQLTGESYYKKNVNESEEDKNKLVVIVIFKLFRKYPEVCKKMVNAAKIFELPEVIRTIDLLETICIPDIDSIRTKQIFEKVLNCVFPITASYFQENEETELKKNLFTNSLTKLRQYKENEDNKDENKMMLSKEIKLFEKNGLNQKHKLANLSNLLKSLNDKPYSNENVTISKILDIEIIEMSRRFETRLLGLDKAIICIPNDSGIIKDFFDNFHGIAKNTVYKTSKNQIAFLLTEKLKEKNSQNYKEYISDIYPISKEYRIPFENLEGIIKALNRIVNNLKVRYGQSESKKFKELIQNKAYIELKGNDENYNASFFRFGEQLALWQYCNYVLSTKKIQDDLEYDTAKKYIKAELDYENKQVEISTENDLRQYNLNLEYLEYGFENSDGDLDV
ncbi:hypothetical protein L2089_07230 [Paenibacillus hunanensis]|uniref:hypothetical protein n=1 Tax=Paenibacillus hunanensis TaxID=539262 RepID=UPI00202759DF|nr:hypothetical protein [Paenibacillus hunanensis]MCL9660473.1 hypothetical protein [Paenibacillus hunanensis]